MIENGGGGGVVTTEFSVVYHCQFIFYKLSKKKSHHKVTEINLCQL